MAKAQGVYVQRGESIDFVNSTVSDIKANDVVEIGTRIGIAGTDIPVGAVGSLHVIGVFDLPATTTEAYALGDAVYFKDGVITSVGTAATPAGWVIEAKATSKAVARVKIG